MHRVGPYITSVQLGVFNSANWRAIELYVHNDWLNIQWLSLGRIFHDELNEHRVFVFHYICVVCMCVWTNSSCISSIKSHTRGQQINVHHIPWCRRPTSWNGAVCKSRVLYTRESFVCVREEQVVYYSMNDEMKENAFCRHRHAFCFSWPCQMWLHTDTTLHYICGICVVYVFELTLRVFHLSNHILGANKSMFITSRGVVVLHRGMVQDVSHVCCIPVKASRVWERRTSL